MSGAAPVENPFAGQGSVMLDIGGDIGALVVTMPAEMAGDEVEIRPAALPHLHGDGHDHAHGDAHDHTHHPHVAVVNRPVEGGRVPSLVFPELSEGRYELYLKGTQDVRLRVDVPGGGVATAHWPS
jgi:hypothetical protein